MNNKKTVLTSTLMGCMLITHAADQLITVDNTSAKNVYAATYWVKGKSNDSKPGMAERKKNKIVPLSPFSTKKLVRPPRDWYFSYGIPRWYDRDLYIAYDPAALPPALAKGSLPFINVGSLAGSTFYTAELGERLGCFSYKGSSIISVYNKTNKPVYAALYYLEVPSHTNPAPCCADRFNQISTIPPNQSINMLRPDKKCNVFLWGTICKEYQDRELHFAADPAELTASIIQGAGNYSNVGELQGDSFYIIQEDGALRCFSQTHWLAQPLHQALFLINALISEKLQHSYSDYPYAHKKATVRSGPELCGEELRFRKLRTAATKSALEKMLNMTLADDEVPTIAICASGGGYRAFTATCGWLSNAESWGLLDSIMYLAGTSGSAWAITSQMCSGLSWQQYTSVLHNYLGTPLTHQPNMTKIADQCLKKIAFNQTISFIDVFGELLQQKLISPQFHHGIHLLTSLVDTGTRALPILTAGIAQDNKPYEFVEFTSYEVSSNYLNGAIPTWAFGRSFKNGTSTNYPPPQSLGFYLGVWGSAMSADPKDIISHLFAPQITQFLTVQLNQASIAEHLISVVLSSVLDAIAHSSFTDDDRFSPAHIPNWMYTMSTCVPHCTNPLTLVDAGIFLNLPIPCVLSTPRETDLIIVLDASTLNKDGITTASELHTTEQYVNDHQLKFPPIDYSRVQNSCSVHVNSNDSTVPTVVYMPCIPNSGYLNGWNPWQEDFMSIFNFNYTQDQLTKLSQLTAYNMQQSKDTIIATVKKIIENKRRKKGVQ